LLAVIVTIIPGQAKEVIVAVPVTKEW
jgi:hypothetical protein